MYRAKEVPDFDEFRRHCSDLNLVKLERLRLTNSRLFEVYFDVYTGRYADESVNALVGKELAQLMLKAGQYHLEEVECARLRSMARDDPRKFWGQFCTHYNRGGCKKGQDCPMIHAKDVGQR